MWYGNWCSVGGGGKRPDWICLVLDEFIKKSIRRVEIEIGESECSMCGDHHQVLD